MTTPLAPWISVMTAWAAVFVMRAVMLRQRRRLRVGDMLQADQDATKSLKNVKATVMGRTDKATEIYSALEIQRQK